MIGAGGHARYQLLALLQVRPIEQVTVWGRRQAAEQYPRDMAAAGVLVCIAATAREAVQRAEVVMTATSSTGLLIEDGWLARGAHVTAVGSDMPHKQELDPRILAAAGKYVPDSIDAAAASGELHHALEAGVGLGIQDAVVVAALAARLASEHGAGQDVPLGDW